MSNYTREAGVRNLERAIGSVCRAVAVKVVAALLRGSLSLACLSLPQIAEKSNDGKASGVTVSTDMLEELLGPAKFEHEVSERLTRPGVAVGEHSSIAPSNVSG